MTSTSPFDVVERIGDVAVFRDGPRPRGPADRHGAVDVDGERFAVFVQTGPSWPMPELLDRGRALVSLRDAGVARVFFFDSVRNKYHWVIERPGGVALPALVRRVRKKAGALPPVTCARIARDLARAHVRVDAHGPLKVGYGYRLDDLIAAVVADTVVTWDGRVVVAPRLFGTPADAPRWVHRPSFVQAVGALLLALLAPDIGGEAGNDVDGAVARMLVDGASVRGTGVDALEKLTARALAAPPPPLRRGRRAPTPPASLSPRDLAEELDDIVKSLGGDDPSFAAALMNELFPDRKRADLAWREEMLAVPLIP